MEIPSQNDRNAGGLTVSDIWIYKVTLVCFAVQDKQKDVLLDRITSFLVSPLSEDSHQGLLAANVLEEISESINGKFSPNTLRCYLYKLAHNAPHTLNLDSFLKLLKKSVSKYKKLYFVSRINYSSLDKDLIDFIAKERKASDYKAILT